MISMFVDTFFTAEKVKGKEASTTKTEVCEEMTTLQLEPVIEHLVGRQGQLRGAQVHAMYLSEQKGRSQDPPLPRPHLRVGSGGESVLSWRRLPTQGPHQCF